MAENMNKRIVAVLSPFGLPVAESLYEGDATEYFYYIIAQDYEADSGDNEPQGFVANVQIHYVCPWENSYDSMLKQIRKALTKAGFSGFRNVDLSEEGDRLREWVIECWAEDEWQMED